MIKQLIWTPMSSVLKKADKLNLSPPPPPPPQKKKKKKKTQKYTDILIFIYWMKCRTFDTDTLNM